jgi:hypothetical protein
MRIIRTANAGTWRECSIQIAEIIRKLDGKIFGWLLVTQQHIFPCEAAIHDTKENLICDLGDAMTCHCCVVAIYHQARRLSTEEIAPLEKAAFDGLGSISKARAQGKI